jgi:type I restriction enzyme S subunit
MFTGLKPYPVVRRSDLPWLPKVPSHWLILRAKDVLRPVDVRSGAGEETLLTVSSSRGVVPRSSENVTMFQAASYTGHKLCWPGDLVINSLWAWGRGLGVSRHHGIVSTAYGVYRPRDTTSLNADFLHLLVRSEPFHWELQVRSRGVWISRLQLTDDSFLRAPIPLPPPEEQAAIVRYLAQANRRIDQAIAAKRKLIRLLEEQRQVIISHAVTRGLDPSAPMKDSSVAWLGKYPSHWVVASLRHRYTQSLGKMLDTSRIEGKHLLPYLRNTDVQWDRINTVGLPEMDISPREYARYTVEPGDLLVCEGGEIGRAAIWDGGSRTGFQKALHRLRPQDASADSPRFLLYLLRAATWAGAFSDGHVSTISHLTGEKLRRTRFAWPPVQEQFAIVQWLDSNEARSSTVIQSAVSDIRLLREFRTRLAADVVTGQVDVREIAATLPELDPEDLPPRDVVDDIDFDELEGVVDDLEES